MTDEQKIIWKRMKKGNVAKEFMRLKELRRVAYMKEGVENAQYRAFAEILALPQFARYAEGDVPADHGPVVSELQRIKAADDLRATEAEAKRLIVEATGSKVGTQKGAIEWAIQWMHEAAAGPDGVVRWSRVKGAAPSKMAITYLEMAAVDSTEFTKSIVMKHLKDDDREESWKPAARKQVAECCRMLEEVKAEVAANGVNAYAG